MYEGDSNGNPLMKTQPGTAEAYISYSSNPQSTVIAIVNSPPQGPLSPSPGWSLGNIDYR